jgi:hypothetical protein
MLLIGGYLSQYLKIKWPKHEKDSLCPSFSEKIYLKKGLESGKSARILSINPPVQEACSLGECGILVHRTHYSL